MGKKNAVEKRLELLHDQWTEFAQLPDARLLRWVVEPLEVRMVEAFLAKEGDERTGECPDLFLRFDVPFEQPARYGFELRDSLASMAEESKGGLAEAGLASDWKSPPAGDAQTGMSAFLNACASLRSHYESLCDQFVAVLMPKRVTDATAWLSWLRATVEEATSPGVRIVVLDDARSPSLVPLAEAFPKRVVTISARLEMGKALEELSKEAGQLDTPSGQFRDLFVRLSNATARGLTAQAQQLGDQLVALAQKQGWHSLLVAAHFVMGGGLFSAQKPEEALKHYRKAEQAASEAISKGDEKGATLRLKALMAQGAALVSARDYKGASALYQDTSALACELKDSFMEVECWRMASWCCEMVQDSDQAWEHIQRAWELGRVMDESVRVHSTLPYVGEALVRICLEQRGDLAAQSMETELTAVLGKNWRPKTGAGGHAS